MIITHRLAPPSLIRSYLQLTTVIGFSLGLCGPSIVPLQAQDPDVQRGQVQEFQQTEQTQQEHQEGIEPSPTITLEPPTQERERRQEARNRRRQANQPTSYWPAGVEFNRSIPSPKQFFGFDLGERHLRHDQLVAYLLALADRSERITLEQYGESHGFRPLLLLTITSPNNLTAIARIQNAHRQLAQAERSSDVDIESLPVVVNMGYGVHGDEPSASNCAVLIAYYLAAAEGEEIHRLLDSTVVLLDPALNPDGFDRFANWVNMYRGKILNSDPAHAEHQQSWHRGRTNYYWFDLNRDWLPLVHPESQSRMQWYHAWKPNVVLDFHEMGTNSTYFFQPGIPSRTNPLTPKRNIELTGAIGDYHAKRFDTTKTLYFTQEMFDDFYMGKGSTYPDLHGAIGILFEQASSRGHLQESENGLLSFPTTIQNQFSASLSSLAAASELRLELHDYKRWFYQSAMHDALFDEASVHMFVANGNESRINALAVLFQRHDIVAYRLKENMRYGDHQFDSRFSLAIPTDQSEYRFLLSLIERRTEFEENIFYDVSAWTIPLAYDIEHIQIPRPLDASLIEPYSPRKHAEDLLEWSDDDVAYLVGWQDDAAPKWLYQALEAELLVKVATRPVTVTSRGEQYELGFGSLMIPLGVEANRPGPVRRLIANALRQGLQVVPVSSGLTDSVGVDLGSSYFRTLEKPEVALVVEGNVSSSEAGEIWHALDTRVELPVTLLKSGNLGSIDRYNKLVLAGGRYERSAAIENWVRRGGTLIACGSAINFATQMLKLDAATETDQTTEAAAPKAEVVDQQPEPIQKRFIDAQEERALTLISGAIFNANIDPTHPLFYGYPRDSLAVFRNHTRRLTKSDSPYGNPLVYATDSPLLAGYASESNQKIIGGQPGIVVHSFGQGRMILINDNLNFRGFWLGTQRAFINAIFFGQFTNPPSRSDYSDLIEIDLD